MDRINTMMSINKNYRFYLKIFLVVFVVFYVIWSYIGFIQKEKETLQKQNYQAQCLDMKKRLEAMILAKQKSTVAMALILVNDKELVKNLSEKNIPSHYYKKLIDSFKKNTLYQNIWIQILDKDLNSIYRSWSDERDDNLENIRANLKDIIKKKKTTYAISAGKYSLSINAMVPIIKDDKTIGLLEVISHFNSISKQMRKLDVESVVLLDKEYTKQLKYPFTNIFVNGYYIANFDVSATLIKHLKDEGIEGHLSQEYNIDGSYLRVAYPLKSLSGKTLGYYIMFKKVDDISNTALNFTIFKLVVLGLLVFMFVAGVINFVMFYLMRKQKIYYKNIINSSSNIVLITDTKHILEVNKIFFKYFYEYKTLDDFKMKHRCISEMFVEDDKKYISKEIDGFSWIKYVVKHSDKNHKVKLKYNDNIYYFVVGIALVSEEKEHYSVVFSDISNEERYKIELEKLAVTDALTGIGNRRYFHDKIDKEISSAIRYNHPLSFVMIDIDHFKRINDKHGHDVGDDVLVEYTKLISKNLREGDIFARVGGEEFMIIFPYANLENAYKIAEKLRREVQNHKKVLPITMSFGVVQYCENECIDSMLKRVDEALYEAKDGGRNKVVMK